MATLYRTYRPQTFDEVIGQESTITILKNALLQETVAHAYLFYGPRGTGKTTTARIFAKTLNCLTRQTDPQFKKKGIPCNSCEVCRAIDARHALDIVEIDAASHRGIDDIRELQDTVSSLPSLCRKKIVIIDEVHMLTPQAFNALLKTLEEPPEHVVFILATTEYEKVPATIVSRTQRFHFRRLTLQEIRKKLSHVIEKESLTCDDDALSMIAFLADGSLRDAESLLDQMVHLQKGPITTEAIEKIMGKVDFAKIVTLSEHIIHNDLKQTLSFLHEIQQQGHNIPQLTKDVINHLRFTLSLKSNPHLEELFSKELTPQYLEVLKKHAQEIETEKTIRIIQALITAHAQMKTISLPALPLELALIEQLRN